MSSKVLQLAVCKAWVSILGLNVRQDRVMTNLAEFLLGPEHRQLPAKQQCMNMSDAAYCLLESVDANRRTASLALIVAPVEQKCSSSYCGDRLRPHSGISPLLSELLAVWQSSRSSSPLL